MAGTGHVNTVCGSGIWLYVQVQPMGFTPRPEVTRKSQAGFHQSNQTARVSFLRQRRGNGREGSVGDTLKYPQSVYTVGKEVKGNAEMQKVTEVGKWDVILQVEQCLFFVHLSP